MGLSEARANWIFSGRCAVVLTSRWRCRSLSSRAGVVPASSNASGRSAFMRRSPSGTGGASMWEGREAWGATPLTLNQAAEFGGWRAGCRLDWRAHCPAGCEGGISSERDRRSRRVVTQLHIVRDKSQQRGPFGEKAASGNYWRSERTICVVCSIGKQGQRTGAQRGTSEHRSDGPCLHAIRRTERTSSQRGRGPCPVCLKHDTRQRASGASIIGACLRRIQAAERNVAKAVERGRFREVGRGRAVE